MAMMIVTRGAAGRLKYMLRPERTLPADGV